MALEWDYTSAASEYDARPGYAEDALAACFDGVSAGARACDIGAGTGRLTAALEARALRVVAVEPNEAMRARGVARSGELGGDWVAGVAEALPLLRASVDLVTFGSSFNVVDRPAALAEAARVLVPGGRLVCLWNHRVLDDPLQRRIETVIRRHVPEYDYGTRRARQDAVISADLRFADVRRHEAACVHRIPGVRWLAAWQTHLTLRRQAGARFPAILAAIEELIGGGDAELAVPYVTIGWVATRDT